MVVGVEPEQRQVRVHHLHVDAVEVHVFEDVLGVTFGHPPAGLAIPGDRPALVPRRVQLPEDAGAAFDERLDLEVFFPDRAVPQVLRQARAEQVGGLEEVPVRGDDKVLRSPSASCECAFLRWTDRYTHYADRWHAVSRDEAVEATPGRLHMG